MSLSPSCSTVKNGCFGYLDGSDEHENFALRGASFDNKGGLEEAEGILASEMNKLSIQEISKALDDVHCVGTALEENAELVRCSLLEFDELVRAEQNPVYGLAASQDQKYVENDEFRIKFLRATFYDVKKSVNWMMKFLNFKASYFGNDKVGRDIELSDLNQGDIDLMKSGFFHIQGGRDRSGRIVNYVLNHLLTTATEAGTVIRIAYYIFYNLLIPIPDVQMKGGVGVYYDTIKPGERLLQTMSLTSRLSIISFFTEALPFRFSSFHICLKARKGTMAVNQSLIGVIINGFSRYSRVRTRLHYGSDMELQYQLQSHGIPMKACPIDSSGAVRPYIFNKFIKEHLDWIEAEKTRGSSRTPTISVRQDDVLLGRGKGYQNHLGNINFRLFLEPYRDEYDGVPRAKKSEIAVELSQKLTSNGVRFLKLNEDKHWIEGNTKEVEEKIGQLFRSFRKKDARK
eukprot:scaffold4024_cov85-Cylindrotheca_fusiformis.AAC.4